MKSETLERLIVDRASGGLSSDVAELLESYLELFPDHRITANDIEETVRLAKRALAIRPEPSLPKIHRLRLAPKSGNSLAAWRRKALAMAACFVVGVSLGHFAPMNKRPVFSTEQSQVPLTAPPPTRGLAQARRIELGAWKLQPTRQHTAQPTSARSQFIWKTLFKSPENPS